MPLISDLISLEQEIGSKAFDKRYKPAGQQNVDDGLESEDLKDSDDEGEVFGKRKKEKKEYVDVKGFLEGDFFYKFVLFFKNKKCAT